MAESEWEAVETMRDQFQRELGDLITRFRLHDDEKGMPAWLLAQHLDHCLSNLRLTMDFREKWLTKKKEDDVIWTIDPDSPMPDFSKMERVTDDLSAHRSADQVVIDDKNGGRQ